MSPACAVRTPPLSLTALTSHLPGGGDTPVSGLVLMPHGERHLPLKVGFQAAKSLRPAPSPWPGVCRLVSGQRGAFLPGFLSGAWGGDAALGWLPGHRRKCAGAEGGGRAELENSGAEWGGSGRSWTQALPKPGSHCAPQFCEAADSFFCLLGFATAPWHPSLPLQVELSLSRAETWVRGFWSQSTETVSTPWPPWASGLQGGSLSLAWGPGYITGRLPVGVCGGGTSNLFRRSPLTPCAHICGLLPSPGGRLGLQPGCARQAAPCTPPVTPVPIRAMRRRGQLWVGQRSPG